MTFHFYQDKKNKHKVTEILSDIGVFPAYICVNITTRSNPTLQRDICEVGRRV